MKSKNRLPICGTGALAIFASFGAHADAVPPANALEDVVVVGVRQALRDSVIMKQKSELISDNISTTDIGALPDVTIAEELNRLPGVNTTRDRGNSSQASVRGLGPRLVLGLVNGREVASSEPSQDLRWEIYPSEILAGAVVNKAQDATLIPGGIAATIDIRTRQPLEYTGPEFSFRAGPTYNSIGKDLPGYNPVGFRGSGGFTHHITDDVAVSIAASVQREKNGFPDFRTFGWNTAVNSGNNNGDLNGDGVNDNTTWGLVTEVKEVTQDRGALAGSLGWRASDSLTVKADALWSQYEIKENQFQAWYGNNKLGNWAGGNDLDYNAPGNSYSIVDGSVVAGTLNNFYPNYQSQIARYQERHTLLVSGLNATWKTDRWENSLDLSYSEAWRRNRWEAIYLAALYPPNLVFDVQDGHTPYGATPGYNPADPSLQSADGSRNGQSDGPEVTKDTIGALAADFSRSFDNSVFSGIKFGGRVSNREKTHHSNRWNLCAGTGSTTFTTPYVQGSQVCPVGTGVVSLANAGLSSFNVPGFTAPPMVYGNFDALRSLVYPNDAEPAGSEMLLVHTTVKETSTEGYLRVDFKTTAGGMPLTGDLGARVAHLSTKSSGFQSPDGTTFTPVSVSNDYTDFLPSLNLVLHIAEDMQLRFGASVAIARPPLDALVTGFSLNPTGIPPTGGGGNPTLKPYKSNNLDLSYEWYYHPESLLAVAVYYKNIKDMIGAGQSLQTIGGVNYIITSEQNTPGGDLAGVELTYQTRFFFLPGLLKNFGVYANYAYVESNIHEVAPVGNPYPMIGLAKGTSEFDLFYNQGGFESRVAWKHHTEFTVAPTWVGTTLKGLAPESTLDASFSYVWTSGWTVRLQGHNLTNERARFSSDNNLQNLSNDGGYQVYGRSYLADIGVRF